MTHFLRLYSRNPELFAALLIAGNVALTVLMLVAQV
jgi:hypothetical protein